MKTRLLPLAALAVLLVGCDGHVKSTRHFKLPPGNPDSGKAAFIALNCTACHTVNGITLPKPTAAPELVVALGGEVARLRTYGDLLTAIVHPTAGISDKMPYAERRKIATSPMPSVNDTMTVTQLINLVAFLQPQYRQLTPIYESDYLP